MSLSTYPNCILIIIAFNVTITIRLGLYSMRKRVDALNGKCGIRDRTDGNQGSCFWFTFPYRPDEEFAEMALRDQSTSDDFSNVKVADSILNDEGPPLTETTRLDLITPSCHSSFKSLGEILNEVSIAGRVDFRYNSFYRRRSSPASSRQSVEDQPSISVLLVDDSLAILKMCCRNLESGGFQVTIAENGLVALKILKERGKEFDMMLTDLQMPVMDGLECVRRFRSFERSLVSDDKDLDPLVIIGMSANSDEKTKKDSLDVGMDAFLSKPFNIKQFQELLKTICPRYMDQQERMLLTNVESPRKKSHTIPGPWAPPCSPIDYPRPCEKLILSILPKLPETLFAELIHLIPAETTLSVLPELPKDVCEGLMPLLPVNIQTEISTKVFAKTPEKLHAKIPRRSFWATAKAHFALSKKSRQISPNSLRVVSRRSSFAIAKDLFALPKTSRPNI
jgi:CheY-like chemotaxis protein